MKAVCAKMSTPRLLGLLVERCSRITRKPESAGAMKENCIAILGKQDQPRDALVIGSFLVGK
jgi:hypothetical protein